MTGSESATGLDRTLEFLMEAVARGDRAARMLCGVAAATQALLADDDLDSALDEALRLLLRATGLDRVSVFERVRSEAGDGIFERRAFAVREDLVGACQPGPLSPQAFGADSWRALLLRGRAIRANVDQIEDAAVRARMQERGVSSLMLVPIRLERATWGFIGFYDLTGGHDWSNSEECVLASVATALSFALLRGRAEDERLELERQVLQRQKLDSLALLAGGVAHDMNNLLMMLTETADRADLDETVDRMSELCRQLMLYAGDDEARRRTATRIDELAGQTAHLLLGRIPDDVDLDPRAIAKVPEVQADPTQIRQALMNLILNAAEALVPSGGTIRLGTRQLGVGDAELVGAVVRPSKPCRGFVEISVADDGPGIPEDLRARIFDPLFTTKDAGHGLGLATVVGAVRSHDGAPLLDAGVPRGTCFRMLFPLPDPRSGDDAA